jgi:hypothetical protein
VRDLLCRTFIGIAWVYADGNDAARLGEHPIHRLLRRRDAAARDRSRHGRSRLRDPYLAQRVRGTIAPLSPGVDPFPRRGSRRERCTRRSTARQSARDQPTGGNAPPAVGRGHGPVSGDVHGGLQRWSICYPDTSHLRSIRVTEFRRYYWRLGLAHECDPLIRSLIRSAKQESIVPVRYLGLFALSLLPTSGCIELLVAAAPALFATRARS